MKGRTFSSGELETNRTLGSNNALQTVANLKLNWSGDGYANSPTKGKCTFWLPHHFEWEMRLISEQFRRIGVRHVIWSTVPHVTIAPVSRGLGGEIAAGSRCFSYYYTPQIDNARFDPQLHPHLTGDQTRAIDYTIDMFNDCIQTVVARGRAANHDWYLFDMAGLLDRMASRRYIEDPNARRLGGRPTRHHQSSPTSRPGSAASS